MRRLTITNEDTAPSSALWWRFRSAVPPHWRIHRAADPAPLEVSRTYSRFDRFVGVQLRDTIRGGSSVVVEWEGEDPVEAHSFIPARAVARPPDDNPLFGVQLLVADDRSEARTDALMEWHSINNGARSPEERAAASFWWNLDVYSSQSLAEHRLNEHSRPLGFHGNEGKIRRLARDQLSSVLESRLRRSRRAPSDPQEEWSTLGSESAALHCYVLRTLIEHSFGSFDVAGNRERFAVSCHRFAAGLLRLGRSGEPKLEYSNGSPDSWMVCLFGELALFAIERGIDRVFWERALPSFIEMVESFRRAYVGWQPRPASTLLGLHDIEPAHAGGPPVSDEDFLKAVAKLEVLVDSQRRLAFRVRLLSVFDGSFV